MVILTIEEQQTLVIVRTTSVEVDILSRVPCILYPMTSGNTIDIACPNITASASIPVKQLTHY